MGGARCKPVVLRCFVQEFHVYGVGMLEMLDVKWSGNAAWQGAGGQVVNNSTDVV